MLFRSVRHLRLEGLAITILVGLRQRRLQVPVARRDEVEALLLAPDQHAHGDRLQDRKSVVEGKSVDLGGRRIIKKKTRSEAAHPIRKRCQSCR